MVGNPDTTEFDNIINWSSAHLNKGGSPIQVGRQQLYAYNDGTILCVKTSKRAAAKHYWVGLSYDIVHKLIEAKASMLIIVLTDVMKFIALKRDHVV